VLLALTAAVALAFPQVLPAARAALRNALPARVASRLTPPSMALKPLPVAPAPVPAPAVETQGAGNITQIGSTGISNADNDDILENFSLATGNNRALIVVASHANDTDITGVSFNGEALTQVVERTDGYSVDSIWVRAMGSAGTVTTGNIVVTRAGSTGCRQVIFAVAYENVDQTTPMDGPRSFNAGGTHTSSSLVVTSEEGDLVFDLIDAYLRGASPIATVGAGQTQLHTASASIACSFGSGGSHWNTSTKPGAASVTISRSGSLGDYIYIAANINRSAPFVKDPTSASVTGTTATLGGNIAAGGASAITDRGIVYAPTTTNSNPRIGGTGVTQAVAAGTSTGVFTKDVTGLTKNTNYSYAAYATNGAGTSYSDVGTFVANTTPVITAGAAAPRTAGAAAASATIATVSDGDNDTLTVTAKTVPTGITVTNISNTNGTVTADVAAGCTATAGANTVVLEVSDGVATATANLTVNVTAATVASITTHPAAQMPALGGSATFSVTATGATGYQWRKGGQDINGATTTSHTINPVTANDAGSYDVVVSGVCGTVISNAAALSIVPAPTLGNYTGASVTAGGATTMTPDAEPTNTTSVSAYVATAAATFTGLLTVDPATGVVRVTNAQPAGPHTVTVRAFGAGGSVTKTFTLTAGNPVACDNTSFSGATDVGVGFVPYSVATGDFDGDGKLDFAAANSSGASVSIRLGDGAGGFNGTTDVGVDSSPYSVATGDFNGDGKLDFAAANHGVGTVSIRLGDGAGGFNGTTEVGVGSTPRSVATGDFNGDGKLDFATANAGSNTVSIRLGDGAGGFSGTTNVSVGSSPYSVATGDFNGDGKLDFAAANYNIHTV
ncbi:MAG: beta strand repeat-containing protein, partial [Blastocatellia bacterium]